VSQTKTIFDMTADEVVNLVGKRVRAVKKELSKLQYCSQETLRGFSTKHATTIQLAIDSLRSLRDLTDMLGHDDRWNRSQMANQWYWVNHDIQEQLEKLIEETNTSIDTVSRRVLFRGQLSGFSACLDELLAWYKDQAAR
jgi:hypothetical protein